jgi:hypothetical protein
VSIEGDLGQIIIEDNVKKEEPTEQEPFYIMSYSNKEGKWLKYV